MQDKNNIYSILKTINSLEPTKEELVEQKAMIEKPKTLLESKMEEVLMEKYKKYNEDIIDVVKSGAKKIGKEFKKALDPDAMVKAKNLTPDQIKTLQQAKKDSEILKPYKNVMENFLPRSGFDDYIKNLKRDEDLKIISKEYGSKKATVRYSVPHRGSRTVYEVVWTAGNPHPKKRQVHDEPGNDEDESGEKIKSRGRGRPKGSSSGAREGGARSRVDEGKMKELSIDLEEMSDEEFKKEHGMTKAECRKKFGLTKDSSKETKKEEVEEIDEGARETQKRASELADKLRKKDPEKSKVYQNLAAKASQRSYNPTGVSRGKGPIGQGNKAQRKLGKEPVPSPMSSDRMRGYYEEKVDESEKKSKEKSEEKLAIPDTKGKSDKERHEAIMKKYPNAKKVGKTPGAYASTGKGKADLVSGIQGVRKITKESVIERMINESYEELFYKTNEAVDMGEADARKSTPSSDEKKDEVFDKFREKVNKEKKSYEDDLKDRNKDDKKNDEKDDKEEVKENTMDNELQEMMRLAGMKTEGKSCNHTMEGEECPVHGLKECGMYEAEMEEGWNKFTGALEKAKDAGKDSFEVDGKTYQVKESDNSVEEMKQLAGLNECGIMGSAQPTEQEGRMNVSTNMSSDGTKSVTVTADGDAAVELMQMLTLAGMSGAESNSPTIAVASTSPEEEIYPTSENEQMEKVEEVMGNTPNPEVMPVQMLTKGGDGEVAGEEKQMNPNGSARFSDNPLAMEDNIFSGRFLNEYESIKAKS